MRKRIILFLGMVVILTNYDNSQKHFRLYKTEFKDSNEFAKFISFQSNFKHNHPFIKFIEKYKDVAILYQIEYGIPVSIQLAQAITESGGGNCELGKNANNIFGMKYYKEMFSGEYYTSSDGTKWRKYPSIKESFRDHAEFLNKYYNHAVNKDWEYWVKECKGYGGPGYWKFIGDVIKKYKLYEYDDLVVKLQNKNKSFNI
jgi:flagellum-specific peptidoglycan hydrolase FlgJ